MYLENLLFQLKIAGIVVFLLLLLGLFLFLSVGD